MSSAACVIFSYGEKFRWFAECARDSFIHFHPDVDCFLIDDRNCSEYVDLTKYPEGGLGLAKYAVAHALWKQTGHKKMIILDADTITCGRLVEFLDNDAVDILATLDEPFQQIFKELNTPLYVAKDDEVFLVPDHVDTIAQKGLKLVDYAYLNAGVVCFNNIDALKAVIDASEVYCGSFNEQAGLNLVAFERPGKFVTMIVDAPYFFSKVVYNVRSRSKMYNTNDPALFHEQVQQFSVKDGQLLDSYGKTIRVFHYCRAFGMFNGSDFYARVWKVVTEWFNKETIGFFHQCIGRPAFGELARLVRE